MFLHKRGLLYETLIALLIILISLVILTGILYAYNTTITNNIDRNICRLSVYFKYAATTAIFGIGIWEEGKLSCKTEEVKIKTTNEREVMKTLADQMRWCWWKLGEGKIDFLSDIDVGYSDSRCIICSKMLAENAKFDSEIEINKFSDYLNKNSYKFGDKKTYSSYFYGAENSQVDFGNEGVIAIDDEVPNYIIFIANKRGDIYNALTALGVIGIGGTTASALISPVATARTFLKGGSFVFKNIVSPKNLLKGASKVAIPLTVVGLAIDLSYAPDFYSTLVLVPGDEMVNRCDIIE